MQWVHLRKRLLGAGLALTIVAGVIAVPKLAHAEITADTDLLQQQDDEQYTIDENDTARFGDWDHHPGHGHGPRPYPPYPYPPRPYPPYPPYPPPPPHAWRTSCTISTYVGTFTGEGYDESSAIDDARDRCLRVTNSRACWDGSVSCYRY